MAPTSDDIFEVIWIYISVLERIIPLKKLRMRWLRYLHREISVFIKYAVAIKYPVRCYIHPEILIVR